MQAEQRATVPHQIKFHVTSPTIELELALAYAVIVVFTPLDNRQVSVGKAIAHRLHKTEGSIKIRRIQIVKEQPANATLLVPVLQVEILIAPLLVFRVDVLTKGLAQVVRGLVPVDSVFFKPVERR